MSYPTEFTGTRILLRFRRQTGPTPGCNAHSDRLGLDAEGKRLKFERWCDLPNAAKALYWRMHPEEYPWNR